MDGKERRRPPDSREAEYDIMYESLGDSDEAHLLSMGYKQELMRGLGTWSNTAINVLSVGILSSISVSFSNVLSAGGPAVAVWGWVAVSLVQIAVAASMAEICSTYPAAGSVYHWTGQLADEEHAPLASYITGWFNLIGNVAGDASFSYGLAGMISSMSEVSGHGPLSVVSVVVIAILFEVLWALQNAVRIDKQGTVAMGAAVLQAMTVLALVFIVMATDNRASSEFVWTTTNNGTGFDGSFFYVVLLGLLFIQYSFCGFDTAAHLCEETTDASRSGPRSILYTVVISAVIGFVWVVGLLYLTTDIDKAMNSDSAITTIFSSAVGPKGAVVLTVFVMLNLYLAGVSSFTATSRITFAMARDSGIPFASWLYVVDPQDKIPYRVIFASFLMDSSIILLCFFGREFFVAILSICTIGLQISFLIPLVLKMKGLHNNTYTPTEEFNTGRISKFITYLAIFWLSFTSFLFLLPTSFPVTSKNFNWTGPVLALVFVIALVNWKLSSRFTFVGPRRVTAEL